MPLDSIQHSKTYFLGKMKKFRESRFQIKQSPSVMYFAFLGTYYLRKTQNPHLIGVLFCKKLSKILLRFHPPTIREISENSLIIGFFPLGKISTESTNYKRGLMNYETPPSLRRPHRPRSG